TGGADYYQFRLKLSFEEKQKIIERLGCQFIRPHTCSGNIAYVLSSDAKMTFPWVVTWLPSTFAEHLYIKYLEPGSRVVDVTYVGTNPDANILKAFTIGRWAESYFCLIKLSASFIGLACGFNITQIILLQFFSSFLKKFK
ncbi:MAG TPA: hypothetical protein DCE71_05545, partial [Parachlamydiales bacterium]|nr:hypothetical protein [Parachlamydiales bacterium]